MKLKVLFRSNNYSPCWELSEMFNAEQTILNRIANPLESESKEYVPLWAFYSLSPFAFPSGENGGYRLYSCRGENMGRLTAIVLDYDHGTVYDDVKTMIGEKGWKAYMHTSFSHSEEENRFRVIMPLQDPIEAGKLKERTFRDSIFTKFQGCDPCSLSIARFFKMPACPKDRMPMYRYDALDGKFFNEMDYFFNYCSMNMKQQAKEVARKEKEYRQRKILEKNEGRNIGAVKWVRNELEYLPPWNMGNNNHQKILSFNGWLTKKIGLNQSEREDIILPYINPEYEKEVKDIINGIS